MSIASNIQLNKQLKGSITKLIALSGALLVGNLLLTTTIFRQDLRVLLVPTHLNKELMTSIRSVSEEYLGLVTRDYIELILNLTPESYEHAETSILKCTHPSYHKAVQAELKKLAKDVKVSNLALSFTMTDMVVDKQTLTVHVTGYLEASIGAKPISRKLHKYRVSYDFTSSRLTLKEFYEVEI